MSESQALQTELAAAAGRLRAAEKPVAALRAIILGTGSIVVLLIVWELLPRVDHDVAPAPSCSSPRRARSAARCGSCSPPARSGRRSASAPPASRVGLGLAIVVGLPLGVLIGRSRTLNAMFDPFITAFNATPRLVFLPLVMLWFGLGLWSKVVIVFIGALFPILINTYEGVRNSDKLLINVVRSFGAKEWDIARLVVMPNAMPYIVAGLRLAIGRAVLGVVVAEFFGSESGLGVMMVQAAGRYQVDIVFAGLIVFAVMTLAMTGGGAGAGEPARPLAAAARRRGVSAAVLRSVRYLRPLRRRQRHCQCA